MTTWTMAPTLSTKRRVSGARPVSHEGKAASSPGGQKPSLIHRLGPASIALVPFFGGSPTKIDYRKKGTLILTSLLADLVDLRN